MKSIFVAILFGLTVANGAFAMGRGASPADPVTPAEPGSFVDDGVLRRAVEMDDVSKVKKFITSGKATVDTHVIADNYADPGVPILALAARAGSENVASYLIQAGADLNLRTSKNETALMLAAFFPDEIGGDVNVYDKHERIVRMLVEAGAELENLPGQFTALAYSAFYNHIRIGRYLLDHGALPDGGTAEGKSQVPTGLMFAAMNGHKDFVRLLLERGADPRIVNFTGNDALALAKKNNQTHLIPLLDCALALGPGETFANQCNQVR